MTVNSSVDTIYRKRSTVLCADTRANTPGNTRTAVAIATLNTMIQHDRTAACTILGCRGMNIEDQPSTKYYKLLLTTIKNLKTPEYLANDRQVRSISYKDRYLRHPFGCKKVQA